MSANFDFTEQAGAMEDRSHYTAHVFNHPSPAIHG